jgi:hypothetical protein
MDTNRNWAAMNSRRLKTRNKVCNVEVNRIGDGAGNRSKRYR